MPIKWHDYTPPPKTGKNKGVPQLSPFSNDTGVSERDTEPVVPMTYEPSRPRTVKQQERHLERFPPVVINNEGSRCQLCGRHKAVVATTTIWRHSHYVCEGCLNWLLGILERHDT